MRNLLRATPTSAHAMYAGDDATDLDAFRALAELAAEGRLRPPCASACAPTRGPPRSSARPTCSWTGPGGVHRLLEALLPS